MAKTIKAAGEGHTIKKNKKGDVIVDHAGNKGKYDKINLTKKAGAKTIQQGVKAVKKYHRTTGK
jgi:hypothetical protein